MPVFYNIEYFKADLIFVQNDTALLSLQVTLNDVAFDMTGYLVEMMVRRKDGLLVKSWTSAGLTPDITIATDLLTLYATGFTAVDYYDYDISVKDTGVGGFQITVMRGTLSVVKEYTK